jgi:hypothetical protein
VQWGDVHCGAGRRDLVRTESGFDQRDMSSAKAVGLMQVTPAAGRDTAKRFGVTYDWKRLVSDPVYNTLVLTFSTSRSSALNLTVAYASATQIRT